MKMVTIINIYISLIRFSNNTYLHYVTISLCIMYLLYYNIDQVNIILNNDQKISIILMEFIFISN